MNIEEKINEIVDRVLNEELSKRIEDTIEMVTEAEDRDEFDGRKSKVVGVYSNIKKQRMEEGVCESCGKEICECGSEMAEEEVEEGNAFSAARAEAIKKGEDSFEVDGKTYPVEGEEDELNEDWDDAFLSIGDMGWHNRQDKKYDGDFDFDYDEEDIDSYDDLMSMFGDKQRWFEPEGTNTLSIRDNGRGMFDMYKEKYGQPFKLRKRRPMGEEAKPDFLDLDKDGDKKEPMKKAAKDAKNESTKKVVTLSESEMIELIQRLVMEQKEAIGMKETEKTLKDSKKVNDEAMKEVNKKMADYVKPGSNEKYDAEPTDFPKGNGEMGEEDKMMYHASDAVEEYIDQIARSGGQENLEYDAIKPDEEWIEMNIMGDSKTGNSQEYANAVKTDANEKVNDRRKKNWLAQLKKQSYNKAVQPVEDVAGRKKSDKPAMSPDEVMSAIAEGTDTKKSKKINEDIERIKGMFGYNQKTQ